MQENAEAIDAALTQQQAGLNSYLSRWYWSAVMTTAETVASGSGTVLPTGSVGASFLTDANALTITANGFPATRFFASTFRFPTGLYLMGTSVKWTVAAPTNTTSRTLSMYRFERVNGAISNSTVDELYRSVEYENSAPGGDGSLNTVGFAFADETTTTRTGFFDAGFSHTNVGDLVIPAGGWRMWFIHLGSGLAI